MYTCATLANYMRILSQCFHYFPDIYEVGVHIADVSYFVAPGTPLDDVASKRATSVYLVQRVRLTYWLTKTTLS